MEHRARARLARVLVAALAAGVLAAGCGEKKKARPPPPVAARVDGQAITLAEIERVLEQQPALRAEQVDAASRQWLARLVDQRLLAAQALRLDLDRDPRVREHVEAATREILARAYADRLDDKAPPPTPAEVDAYYRAHPERFAQRRVYTLQELAIDARPEQIEALRAQLQGTASIAELARELQAHGLRFSMSQAVRAAEQLPPQALQALARLQDGQAVLLPTAKGAHLMVRLDARLEPLAPEQARAVIGPLLLAERHRQRLQQELQTLRAAARIEYKGRFAEGAATTLSAESAEPSEVSEAAAASDPAAAAAAASARDPAARPMLSAPRTTARQDPP